MSVQACPWSGPAFPGAVWSEQTCRQYSLLTHAPKSPTFNQRFCRSLKCQDQRGVFQHLLMPSSQQGCDVRLVCETHRATPARAKCRSAVGLSGLQRCGCHNMVMLPLHKTHPLTLQSVQCAVHYFYTKHHVAEGKEPSAPGVYSSRGYSATWKSTAESLNHFHSSSLIF